MSDVIVRFDLRFTRRAISGALAAAMVLAAAAELNSEAVTLTTYYPAPSGVYTKMITTGDTYLARDGGKVGIGTATPLDALHLANGNNFRWANNSALSSDQGGGIELGGDSRTPGTGTPYIDFHYAKKRQDYNVRIINEADGVLTLAGQVKITGGSPGDGKVLTSDANGLTSWAVPFLPVKAPASCTPGRHGKGYGCTITVAGSGSYGVVCDTTSEDKGECRGSWTGQFGYYECSTWSDGGASEPIGFRVHIQDDSYVLTTTGKQNNHKSPAWSTLTCSAN